MIYSYELRTRLTFNMIINIRKKATRERLYVLRASRLVVSALCTNGKPTEILHDGRLTKGQPRQKIRAGRAFDFSAKFAVWQQQLIRYRLLLFDGPPGSRLLSLSVAMRSCMV